MINFPFLFPDEILYSNLARYHRDSGSENHKQTVDDLFGDRNVCAALLFPSHLAALCRNIPIGSKLTPEELIANHTFFPYYAPFLSHEKNLGLEEIMILDKGASVYMHLGKPASTLKAEENLKYCPNCVVQDRETYGEAYWHRSHQAEGVFICHYHNNVLIRSNVSHAKQRNKHVFISLESILEDTVGHQQILIQPHSFEIIDYIAKQTYILLNYRFEPLGLENINQFYVMKLQRMGLSNHSGRIRWADVIPAFTQFFGKELLMSLQSYIAPSQEATWLHKLLRKPRVTCHPLRHLLVLKFLGETVESTYNGICHDKLSFEPFGKGPWPCLNKAAKHYNDSIIQSCEVTRDSKTGKPVGTFSCSCGFVYSRKGPDQTMEDRFRVGRVKKFGEEWSEKLRVIAQEDIPLRGMARILGCDPKTVVNNLTNKDIIAVTKIENQHEIMVYRERWNGLKKKNSHASVTELRRLDQAGYTWLYRHDRKWLTENTPIKKYEAIQKERVNWKERDVELAKEVKNTADAILNEKHTKLIRVTKTEIGKRMGKLPLLFNMLHKLPETSNQLDNVLESIDEFQSRRIEIRALESMKTNTVIKHWELVRASGLKVEFIGSHRELLNGLSVK
ncbi:TnsD family transposase [Paenibacillus pseudetheri]|uniref:Transposon Tn7 transposition protein TnsD C-termianl domain-containing protein n=1 Tax=Paenibacillus pseudetheri TaxID=2897682 RepID=A0ABN8FQ10_9BACL|nr:TnsD family transposase [Paenibacillus pseudetheri]CAH1057589.1 hypothetical protein PAECIP111894_03747 [Paenibacillus pseudetheri]